MTIEKQNDDYRISLEQGTPGFEPPLEGETRAAIINALHLTEDDILQACQSRWLPQDTQK